MKKFIIVCAATLLAVVAVNAQPRAIGGRVAYGVGFSYQHSMGLDNMISVDVDFPGYSGGIGAAATYDWIFPITSWTQKGEWNWYAGVGAGLGFGWPSAHTETWGSIKSRVSTGAFNIGVAGRIGVEYNFWFPLQLSVDWRPVIGPAIAWNNITRTGDLSGTGLQAKDHDTYVGFGTGALYASAICIGVRYRF